MGAVLHAAGRVKPQPFARRLSAVVMVGMTAWGHVLAQEVERGRVGAALQRLEGLARRAVTEDKVPGLAIAVVHRDEVVYLAGFGKREARGLARVDADTVFQLASLSKPMASTVVAMLVGDGIVQWESKAHDLDPAFELHDANSTNEATLRDLFSHRSGLWPDAGNDIELLGYGRDRILARLKLLPPASAPRSRFGYSNFGLTAGAVAAAKAAGVDWETLAETRLYRPLGMTRTSSRYADFVRRPNRAELHAPVDGVWTVLAKRQPDAQAPAGGVSSSVRDLAEWLRLQLAGGMRDGRRLVSEQALRETHEPIILRGANPLTGERSFYGLGWAIDSSPHGEHWVHGGAFSAGGRTAVDLLPSEQLGIVVLCNAFPSGVPEGLAASFYELVLTGRLTRDWVTEWNDVVETAYETSVLFEGERGRYAARPVSAAPPRELHVYEGAYGNAYVGRALVTRSGDELWIALGPSGGASFPLEAFDGDTFVLRPLAEAPTYPTGVTFTVGDDETASSVTIEAFDAVGQGTLERL